MADMVTPGPGCENRSIREAVCVHTKKILDACKDQDCIEDLRVYFDENAQCLIDQATSVKAGSAELLHAYIDVAPVNFNRGFYTVEVRYYYRITVEVSVCGSRPKQISGLAMFHKRCVLFGGQGGAKVFSSTGHGSAPDTPITGADSMPEAVLEVIDPLILCTKLVDVCEYRPVEGGCMDIPKAVADCFPDGLTVGASVHRLYVTLGQFSMIRLERDTQLLMPAYDYCIPTKECSCDDGSCHKDPCEMFQNIQFPVNDFFPMGGNGREDKNFCNGCGC